nr:MAG TPA: hypothetical protein [Inoviridae sp.]
MRKKRSQSLQTFRLAIFWAEFCINSNPRPKRFQTESLKKNSRTSFNPLPQLKPS